MEIFGIVKIILYTIIGSFVFWQLYRFYKAIKKEISRKNDQNAIKVGRKILRDTIRSSKEGTKSVLEKLGDKK